ncbi:hypothetical protein psageK4_052 [Pseudomonas phage psageK4]|uniref:Uncharacterized protein n=1 Tax=Pseudomonas phage psageK4 TaxID=2859563 RepID=A0ABX8SM76_9CAUD|nr:hypothetical protein QGX14_gp052 [Pseudomonas phage psageK4]QXV71706.1 hypothetical protein psageK4_052 [Pseudomonas phage psageK4]
MAYYINKIGHRVLLVDLIILDSTTLFPVVKTLTWEQTSGSMEKLMERYVCESITHRPSGNTTMKSCYWSS